MSEFLKIAQAAIDVAEKITLRYYGHHPKVHDKEDGSPVTIADRSAEKAIIATIKKKFPGHSFYGEEFGRSANRSEYLWVIDPIDGTKNLVGLIPLWGNLLALMHYDEVILGVSNVPLMHERLWAEKGKGAFLNGRRVKVSSVRKLNSAMLSYSSLSSFKARRLEKQTLKLIASCKRARSFGDLWPYHLLASGKLELVAEGQIKPMDIAPFVRIIEEAGGESSDLKGKRFDLNISTYLATNGSVHRQALEILNNRRK
jgi:histidinol-phosphatase